MFDYAFNIFVKIFSVSIAGILLFKPISINYNDDLLVLETRLENLVTDDIDKLIKQGYIFKVDLYYSVIVNDKKVYKGNIIKSLSLTNYNKLSFGDIKVELSSLDIQNESKVLVFVKAKIVEDELFKKSTGFDTSILWDNYVPRIKEEFIYKDNQFIKSE